MFTRDSVIISHNIKTPLTSISRAVGNILQLTYGQAVKSLFANGEQGFFYDPNDLSKMFQDAAGTIPVTGAGQPVGLILDKSKGLALGVEQFPTFDFNNWVSVGGVSTKTSNSITTTSNGGVYKPIPLGSGRVYAIKISGWSSSGGMVRNSGNSNGQVALPVGDFSITIISPSMFDVGAVPNLYFMLFGASSVKIDSLSVKELSGNPAYQSTSASRPILRKNATTGANYLEFDGTDDFLQTSNIDFTATDKISLFAGVRKLSDAATGMVCELSPDINSNTGGFHLVAPNSIGTHESAVASKGSAVSRAFFPFSPTPSSAVITGRCSISTDQVEVRKNGIQAVKATVDQGTGNYGNYPLYIGRRGGTSLPFNGHIYSLIGIGKLTSDSETTVIEKELAKRTGVTLNV